MFRDKTHRFVVHVERVADKHYFQKMAVCSHKSDNFLLAYFLIEALSATPPPPLFTVHSSQKACRHAVLRIRIDLFRIRHANILTGMAWEYRMLNVPTHKE